MHKTNEENDHNNNNNNNSIGLHFFFLLRPIRTGHKNAIFLYNLNRTCFDQ